MVGNMYCRAFWILTTYVLGKVGDQKACEFLIRLLEEDDTLVCVGFGTILLNRRLYHFAISLCEFHHTNMAFSRILL